MKSVKNFVTPEIWTSLRPFFSCVPASEKREAMEKKLRAKLEEEVKELRGALAAQKLASLSGDDVLDADDPMLSGLGGRASASLVSAESLEDLRRKFSEAEEKVGLEE